MTYTSASRTDDTGKLFANVMALADQESRALREIHRARTSVEDWRRLLSAIPLDRLSFEIRAGHRRVRVIDALSTWCRRIREQRSAGVACPEHLVTTYSYLSIVLITLITLAGSTGTGDGDDTASTDDELCARLLTDDRVRAALLDLYRPEATATKDAALLLARRRWARIVSGSLTFHRRGSTSFILKGHTDDTGRQFALKCVLFPYADIPVIGDRTMRYARDHTSTDTQGRHVEHMVDVWASTTHWILMDFVHGRTLAEEIHWIKHDEPLKLDGSVRLDLIRRLGLPLLDALRELHAQGKQHEDLSPTNVIVRPRTVRGDEQDYEITFIDFGKNYLYAGSLSGLQGPDGTFVAPEVRNDKDETAKADIYSLGKILIALGGVGDSRDSVVPDQFYAQASLLARVLEDLIDADPDQRLMVLELAPDNPDVFGTLAVILKQELDVTQAALEADSKLRETTVPTAGTSLRASLSVVFPISREPAKRRRIYQVRKDQGILDDPRRSMHARWLHRFSIIASINFYVMTLVCFYWLLRDIGVDIVNPVVETGLRLVGARSNAIPLIDSLRRPDYRLGDIAANLPTRLVALSFALANMRYYQNIVSGITARVADSPLLQGRSIRAAAEWTMRIMAVWSSWLILAANLIEVRWWPLGTAIGYTGVLVTNVAGVRFVNEYLRQARAAKLSTVPPIHQKIVGLDAYRQWVPKSAFLVFVVWPFAILIYTHVFRDVYVYASIVVMINIGLLYVITTGIGAGDIRIALNRCYLAAERLRYRAERRAGLLAPVPSVRRTISVPRR